MAALKKNTRFTLLDASTDPGIRRLLDTDWFRSALKAAQGVPTTQPEVKMEFDG